MGSSAVLDVKPLTKIDVLGGVFKKVTELEVAIVANDDSTVKSADDEASEKPTDNEENAIEVVGDGDDEFQDAKSEITDTPTKGNEPNTLSEDEDNDPKLTPEDKTTESGDNFEIKEDNIEGEVTDVAKEDEGATGENEDSVKVEAVDQTEVTVSNEVKEKEEGKESESEGKVAITDAENSSESNEMAETEAEGKLDTNSPPPSMLIPTCVVYCRIEFDVSLKDQKDELYNLLNNASKRKAIAVDKLRKAAALLNRSKPTEEVKGGNGVKTVKSGFLNKKSSKKSSTFLVRWYEKTVGPHSTIRKIFPIAKNYIIFFGTVTLMHFQGQQLALPPPV